MQQSHSSAGCIPFLWSICKMCQRRFLQLGRDSADSENNRFGWLLILKLWRLLLVLLLSQEIHKEPFTGIISPWTVHLKSNWSTYAFVKHCVKSYWNRPYVSMSSYFSSIPWWVDVQIPAAQFLVATFLMCLPTELLILHIRSDRSALWPPTQKMGRRHPFFTLPIPRENSWQFLNVKIFTLLDNQISLALAGLSHLTDKNHTV